MRSEHRVNLESEPHRISKIELNFFRHDEKEKLQPGQKDAELGLTDAGKLHAKSLASLESINQAIAFGSSSQRTQETAGLRMAGRLDDITGEETLDELEEKINKDRQYGTKISIDHRLDFKGYSTTPFGEKLRDGFKTGHFMDFIINESDTAAEEYDDKNVSTYSRMAAGIASIIKKYFKVSKRFDQLVNDETKTYEAEMQRFFGTHQGVPECFLAKILEKMKGEDVRNQFIEAIKPGFDFSEGFKAEIVNQGGEGVGLRIVYNKINEDPKKTFIFDETVPIEIVEEIVEESSLNS